MPKRDMPPLKIGDVVWLLDAPVSGWMTVVEVGEDAVCLAALEAEPVCSWYHRGQVLTAEQVNEILRKAAS